MGKIVSDALDYLYQHDPNFDFENRNIKHGDHYDDEKNMKKIQNYYDKVERQKSRVGRTTSYMHDKDDLMDSDELDDKRRSDNTSSSTKKIWADYNLTKCEEDEIAPAPMRLRAECTLKEVCDMNEYDLSRNDFEDNKVLLGNGSFGEVYLVCCKLNYSKYALKILDKKSVINKGYQNHLIREKDISKMLDHPNIVRLEAYFNDTQNCYFLFEPCRVGDLNTFIKDNKKLNVKVTREFTMQLVNSLEYLREMRVIHRDLKPHNILIDDTFHLKLADFGAAKVIDPYVVEEQLRRYDFNQADDDSDSDSDAESYADSEDLEKTQIGTTLYISPEMLLYQTACHASDLWALGCIIYQCLVGKPPFLGVNKYSVQEKILKADYKFPRKFNKNAKDLIRKLLKIVPHERLGAGPAGSSNDFDALKAHPFFKGKDFNKINNRVPSIKSLRTGFKYDQYNDYSDVYTNEENVSDDEAEPDEIRSLSFKSIGSIVSDEESSPQSCPCDKRRSNKPQKSKFFKF